MANPNNNLPPIFSQLLNNMNNLNQQQQGNGNGVWNNQLHNNQPNNFFGSNMLLPNNILHQMLNINSSHHNTELKLKLKAYSDVFLGKPDLDLSHGDKIILHSNILNQLLSIYDQDELPYPTIFSLKSDTKTTHCGVLEYTAPEESAYLPLWMMQNLFIADGDVIELKLVTLPKVKYVKFQPDYYSFTEIPDPKTTLEYALRKFTCLTKGDCISLHYHNTEHPLTITQLEYEGPNRIELDIPAGCVIDSNIEVDFDPPQEKAPEKIYSVLGLGDVASGTIPKNEVIYYHVKFPKNESFVLKLKTVSGGPVLYVSTRADQPSIDNNLWRLMGVADKTVNLTINPTDTGFSNYFYIAVHAFNNDSKFELTAIAESDMKDSKAESGYIVGQTSSSFDPTTSAICDNCMQPVSKAAMMIHSAQCHRNNWYCRECKTVIPKKSQSTHTHCPICKIGVDLSELEKHHSFSHRKIKCECGSEFFNDELHAHKLKDCIFKKVHCRWCNLLVPQKDKATHEDYCGGKSIECERCNEMVTKRNMTNHLAAKHHVNPCIDNRGNRARVFSSSANETRDVDVIDVDNDLESAITASLKDAPHSREPSYEDLDEDMGDWGDVGDDVDAQMEAAIRASLVETANVSVNVSRPHVQSNIPFRSNASNVNVPVVVNNETHECPICQQSFNSVLLLEEHVNICSMAFD